MSGTVAITVESANNVSHALSSLLHSNQRVRQVFVEEDLKDLTKKLVFEIIDKHSSELTLQYYKDTLLEIRTAFLKATGAEVQFALKTQPRIDNTLSVVQVLMKGRATSEVYDEKTTLLHRGISCVTIGDNPANETEDNRVRYYNKLEMNAGQIFHYLSLLIANVEFVLFYSKNWK